MEFAKLNQRITILEQHTVKDGINRISKWKEILTLWAEVIGQSSVETTNAGVTKEVRTIKFRVRQCQHLKTVNSTNRQLIFNGLKCNIKSVLPDYKDNAYMIILCEIREAGAKENGNSYIY